jgi:hypothetical protein
MTKARKGARQSSQRIELHIGASFAAAWENIILLWFKSVALAACASDKPVLVVLPYPSRAQFFRHFLVRAGISLLGVQFVSPPQLREILLRSTGLNLALREHLRLLLSIAAEQSIATASADGSTEPELAAAKSVLRAPDHLLRTIDEMEAAGWTFEETGPPAFHNIVARFRTLTKKCGFTSVHEADRIAFARAKSEQKTFGNLLVAGFDGAHWPLWPLLSAATKASENATVILTDPRDEARDLDECWIGTWEQAFAAARPIDAQAPSSPLTSSSGSQPQLELFAEKPAPEVYFLLGRETTEEARAIVTLVLKFLADPAGERIGVLFPAPGALARSVATLLSKLDVPHYDSIGHLVAPTLDDLAWQAWLQLQGSNRLRPLLNFLSTIEDGAQLFGDIPLAQIEDVLRRTYRQILIDDIAVLQEYCARHSDLESAPTVARSLATLRFLPATATLPQFIQQTLKIFAALGWDDRRIELERLSGDWKASVTPPFSRASYLRWLGEILGKPTRSRDHSGDHPYSRVQLLSLAEAEGQSWSHLVLAGLNEGAWPPSNNESDFVRDEEIEALNGRIKLLNRRAVVPGRQGEGQWSVTEGKTLCLGPIERRQLALRQMANLMESTESGLGITAALFTESIPRRIANPSEFFTRQYFNVHKRALSQAALEAMEEQTRKWIAGFGWIDQATPDKAAVARTRLAYDARRAEKKAGEFEFALRTPLPEPISLSASQSERLFKAPALIWMKTFLGVQADDLDAEQWNLAVGNWVHEWLGEIVESASPESFGKLGPETEARVQRAAAQFRDQIVGMLQACDRVVPDWWLSTWSNATYVANCFAGHVARAKDWPYAATEWSLRALPPISINGGESLKLRGRLDLILAKKEPATNNFKGIDLWVVDYKTGKRKSLRSSQWRSEADIRKGVHTQLLKGEGVQVALYALALRQLGGENIGMSLLARGLDLSAPQLTLPEITAHEQIWRTLAGMEKSGVFGMRGAIRSEFSFTGDYPLATLAIDSDLLETKWTLTHPALATDSAEEEP